VGATGTTLRRAALAAAIFAAPAAAAAQQPGTARSGASRFEHGQHRNVVCASCHSSARRHGEVMVRSTSDCMACHHGGAQRQNCAQCHNLTSMRRLPLRPRTFRLTASSASVTMSIRFTHTPHTALPCAQCHGAAPARDPDQTNCGSCHALHHGPGATCSTCHSGAHLLGKHARTSHATCATAACHGAAAANLPTSREACLVCHTAQQTHMPTRLCVTCHPVRGSS
jgi:hypothetical protein